MSDQDADRSPAENEEEPAGEREDSPAERRAERRVAKCFAVTVLASVVLVFVYAKGGHPQWEGLLLAVALGGLGCGFVIWARGLMPAGGVEQERVELAAGEDELAAFGEDFEREGVIGRRKLLVRMLGLATAAVAAVAVFPIRSLGPSPTPLKKTKWKKGSKVVDEHGHEVKVDTIPVGGLITVFPEHHAGSGDSQTVLIKVEEGLVKPRPGRENWSPEGLLAYSKVCTHAGCPVGLYQADTHQLICPCHQSAFDVLDGARPVFGPATRSLPQLNLEVGPDGVLHAAGDFDEPIGPGFWNRT